jgi:hypothetical protein
MQFAFAVVEAGQPLHEEPVHALTSVLEPGSGHIHIPVPVPVPDPAPDPLPQAEAVEWYHLVLHSDILEDNCIHLPFLQMQYIQDPLNMSESYVHVSQDFEYVKYYYRFVHVLNQMLLLIFDHPYCPTLTIIFIYIVYVLSHYIPDPL